MSRRRKHSCRILNVFAQINCTMHMQITKITKVLCAPKGIQTIITYFSIQLFRSICLHSLVNRHIRLNSTITDFLKFQYNRMDASSNTRAHIATLLVCEMFFFLLSFYFFSKIKSAMLEVCQFKCGLMIYILMQLCTSMAYDPPNRIYDFWQHIHTNRILLHTLHQNDFQQIQILKAKTTRTHFEVPSTSMQNPFQFFGVPENVYIIK